VLLAAIVVLTWLVAAQAVAAPSYRLIDLGTCTAANDGAQDITENGLVGLPQNVRAYVWNDGTLNPQGGVHNGNSQVRINDLGHIAGADNLRAYIWRDGVTTSLGTLEGGYTFASGINDSDQVVGTSYCDSILRYRGFLWQNGTMVDIGGFLSNGETRPMDINNAGQIVGSSDAFTSGGTAIYEQPFIYKNSAMTQLPILPGYVRGTAESISPAGNIAGTCYDQYMFYGQAMAWIGGQSYNLGLLPGQPSAWASGINDLGQVVGSTGHNSSSLGPAFLWDSGQMYDVNTLILNHAGYQVTEAYSINNAREIVGTSTYAGQTHAVLLMPVPEPSTLVLLGLATISDCLAHAWQRRTKAS
jgi:probable HAF family extracellular repeat protein